LLMGILNANQHFLAPALAPSMNNLGVIAGAVLLAPQWGIHGVAWGAVLGAVLHLGIQLPALPQINFRPRISFAARGTGAGEVLTLMIPRVIGQGATQINFLVNTALAAGMAIGAQTALTVAFALMFVVLGVLGQSVGTAVFPTLAMHHAQGNTAGFRRTLADALRAVLFTTIPAGIGLLVVAVPLIEVLYQRGEWTAQSTVATAWALSFFALGLAAFALQEVLARSFFALRDTRTPVIVGVLGVVFNVLISLLLIRVVQGAAPEQGPFGGLALANVIATLLESIALWVLLRRRLGSLHDAEILGLVGRVSLAAIAMGAAAFATITLLAGAPAFIRLLAAMAVGAVTFEVIAFALNVAEARSVPLTIWRRLRRR
jgi:putative peptidoglycan lipid II flippase